MTRVTNNHTGPLALPGGMVLAAGQTRNIPRWDFIRRNNTVAAWLRARVLVEAEAEQAPAPEPIIASEPESVAVAAVDIDLLREQAGELGIDVDRRWGEKRLRAEIEKAAG